MGVSHFFDAFPYLRLSVMLKSIVQDLRNLNRAMVTSPHLVNVNIGNISISSMVFYRQIMCFDMGLEGAVLPLSLHNPFAALSSKPVLSPARKLS